MKNFSYLIIIFIFFINLSSLSTQELSWQALMDSCHVYQEKQDYKTALDWALKAEVKAKEEFGEMDTNYIATLMSIYPNYYYTGNQKKALEYCKNTLPIIKAVKGNESALYAEVMVDLAFFSEALGNIKKAEELYNEALEMRRRLYKTDHPDLATYINNMAYFFKRIGDYKKAEPLFLEALEMRRRLYKIDHTELAQSINNLAFFYKGIGDYNKAEPLYIKALEMRRRLYKTDHTKLAQSINNLAILYQAIGDYKKAEPLYVETLEMRRRLFKTDHPDLAITLNSIASFYQARGDYNKAEPLFLEALEMRRRIYKTDHPDIAISLSSLAKFYYTIGEFKKIESLVLEALEMNRRIFTTDNTILARSINDAAVFYDLKCNYKKAEPLYIEALEMYKRIFNNAHPTLAWGMMNLAHFYYTIGDYRKAEPLYIEALEMYRRIFKKDHPQLAGSISSMAGFYKELGDYRKAEMLYIEDLEMTRRIFKKDHPDLAGSICNMAAFYKTIGEYKKAEPLYIEALEMERRIYKTDHSGFAMIIHHVAAFYKTIGEYKKAEPLYIEALEMTRRIFKKDHPDLARIINNVASYYFTIGKYKKAEPLYIEALEMRRRLFNTAHPDLAFSINKMAKYYFAVGKYKKAESLYIEALNMYSKLVINYFPSLSESEKEKFWNKYKSFFEEFNTIAITRHNEMPQILCNMFDYQLLTKGILFSSSNNIKRRILNSGDVSLIEKYENLIDLKEMLSQYYTMTKERIEKIGLNIDSLENLVNIQEKEISLKSEAYKTRAEMKKITWKHIQFQLLPDEAVVEMVCFRLNEKGRWTDTIYYAALIITDETIDYPDIVILKNGKDLEEIFYPAYRKSIQEKTKGDEPFNQFWQNIYEKTKKYKKIYFTPDGIYNKINISTFMMPDGEYLLDKQQIHILNSSKDILLSYYSRQEGAQVLNSAELFGNPNFGLNAQNVKEISRKYSKDDEQLFAEMDETTRGAKLQRLPGTEKEIHTIEKFFKSKKWDVNIHTKNEAVKAAVKAIKSPRVLHIATHGMFLEDVKPGNDNLFGMERNVVIENPLLRSGLFFAGASSILRNETAIYREDNGLLTAYEAMNLDLDNTELVVLSACETGLGDIKNGEGVYGLQRAFQQAGAKSILMSLWTINDQTTQELMTAFYEKWLSGKTKREAFIEAQQAMKKKYRHPYYWGAFVMVGE